MSLVGKRAAIASALTTVDGVKGYEYRPTTPRPGDAWVLLGPLEWAEGLSYEVTWRVIVFLPQNEREASLWIDAHHEALVDALIDHAFVDRAAPANLPASGNDQLVWEITMRSE